MFDFFDRVHAEDVLKKNTLIFLQGEIRRRRRFPGFRFAAAFACLAILFLFGAISYNLYYTPLAYIDIDVNPSVELSVNRFGKVVRSSAYNDDGARILRDVKVAHLRYNDALEILLAAINAKGYFQRSNMLYITVQSNENLRLENMLYDLQETIAAASTNHHYNIDADLCSISEEVKHSATACQISPAKYLAIQDLLAVDPDIDFEECKEHSVHELQHLAQEDCSDHKDHICSHGHGADAYHPH